MPLIFQTSLCPACGSAPKGTLARIFVIALFDEADDGENPKYSYSGETDVIWETSTTMPLAEELMTLVCQNCGEEWDSFYTETPFQST